LATIDGVVVSGGRARSAQAALDADALASGHPYLAALDASPFAPPSPTDAGADRADVRALVRSGAIVERDGLYFSRDAVAAAGATVARLLRDHPDGVTVSEVREALGTTRKYLLPLLAHLDATGVTRRRGDVRIAGPRLPEP
ncbi:MAG TPA: SelB C-terminal domain-containing protein, partial [Acidimicrobiales bacterium]